MKRKLAALLTALLVLSMAACGQKPADSGSNNSSNSDNSGSTDVAMKYMTPEEVSNILGNADYTILDVRKAEDYKTSHIPGAVSADMDAAVNGDTEAGKATMADATKGLDTNVVLVCYSGKKYAQASTNALSANGYNMDKVFTLEGGFKAWTEAYADNVES